MGKAKKEFKRGMKGMAKATALMAGDGASPAAPEDALKSPIGMVAPVPDDALTQTANEKRLTARRRTGRASTLISDRGSRLG